MQGHRKLVSSELFKTMGES